ncbi:MAG: DUF2207 domain-containing protein [Alphaproteobacteria bacterium]|nr:DUF2207 domain-containing protein [Alphaproteobacteria bacterium]
MKKFFIYFMLITILFGVREANSSIQALGDKPKGGIIDLKKQRESIEKLYKELPNINNPKEVEEYVKKRLKIVTRADVKEEELSTPNSTSIIDFEELERKQKETMSAYEKIYEESMKRASATNTLNEDVKLDGTFYREKRQEPTKFVPDFPYVTIKLSEDREILAPAEEHIAYFLTTIDITQLGLVNVTEKIVYVANNIHFPEGFIRILPKYTSSRYGKRRRLDFELKSVTINGQEHPYTVTEIGNYLHIEPKTPIAHPNGIHTYEFNYSIDRSVWQYDNFDEFYWDITGKTVKNVIGSANAIVKLPRGETFLAQNATASTYSGLNGVRVTITSLAENVLGFADTEALGLNEDIHLMITLDKNTLFTPTLMQKYLWFIQDYGAELFALLAFLAIFIAYKISLKQIFRNKDKTRANIKKTPAIWRVLNQNEFDGRSFGAEILNLCSKEVVEIVQEGSNIALVKKTDDLKKLSKTEKKFMKLLFPGAETTLKGSKEAALKLKRAYVYLERFVNKEMTRFKLKLNIFYILSNILILVLSAFGASLLATNPEHTFYVIVGCLAIIAPYMYLVLRSYTNKYVSLVVKLFSLLNIIVVGGWLSIYTSKFYAFLVIMIVYTIYSCYDTFSRRNGLMRSKIKETEEYKTFLLKNPDFARDNRLFMAKAPYIYAFSLEGKYKDFVIFEQITKLISYKG